MAGKITRMGLIKQLLQLHQNGTAVKAMARILGISKNTVKNYLAKLEALGLDYKRLLAMDDAPLEALFHSGNPAYKTDQRYEGFIAQLDYFKTELGRRGVTRQLLWKEYLAKTPSGYSYTQFCYHLGQQLAAANPSMVLEHIPGQKLYIDFAGDKLSYCDIETGQVIACEVFVATLPATDFCFAMAVANQTTEEFLYALACCLKAIGGVPQSIVCDNLKAAVVKANRYEPEINRALEDFANHYGTTIVPTRAYRPKDKALVENQVKMIYRRVYAPLRNCQFFSLKELNQAIARMVLEHNQTRRQQKDFCRQEQFLAQERHLLKALPSSDFELKHYCTYKVAKNNHILLCQDRHYYSVPYSLIGTEVKVVYTRAMVYIYSRGQQVAVHQRDRLSGTYTSTPAHLCSAHQHYLQRSPQYYKDKASKISTLFETYIAKLFDNQRPPEQLYRQCDGLLSLARKTEQQIFEKVCQWALDVEVYSYPFILKCIKNKTYLMEESKPPEALPEHSNVRGKAYFENINKSLSTN